ncbi:hypothetical protein [Thermogutta sp.]|jgi:hypothetical protein|uniref:hypothetical protein n=1 Tax=Thermogutta sp. TaxID=1962930 RepID=UPI0032200344
MGEDVANLTGWAAAAIPPEQRITVQKYYRHCGGGEPPPFDGRLPAPDPVAISLGLDPAENDSSQEASSQSDDLGITGTKHTVRTQFMGMMETSSRVWGVPNRGLSLQTRAMFMRGSIGR